MIATTSNAFGMVPGGVSGTWGYRAELAGQGARLRWQIPALVAGAGLVAFSRIDWTVAGLRSVPF